jgi:O-antigen ligase
VVLELGVVGLLLWIALTIKLAALALRRLGRVEDGELQVDLAAVFAGLLALTVMGFSGPTTYTSPAGPAFWFAVGIAAYWLADRGGRAPTRAIPDLNPAVAGARAA